MVAMDIQGYDATVCRCTTEKDGDRQTGTGIDGWRPGNSEAGLLSVQVQR